MKKITFLFGAALLAALSASAGNDIVVKAGDPVKLFMEGLVESKTYDFEDGTLQGWTTIDADGDGFNWRASKDYLYTPRGHNSDYCVLSQSYSPDGEKALTPDNYLIAPMKVKATSDTYISFYATAQDEEYPAEHFGVAVSTTGNTNAADFTTIVQWTFGEAVGIAGAPSQDKAKRSAVRRELAEWVQYKVDLSQYAGDEIWVAIRHFECEDQFYLDVDDITICNYYVVKESKTYDFEDGTLQGWTTIDADGDGFNWRTSKNIISDYKGHNSKYCALSQSYDKGEECALTPDNYMVAPMKVKATEDTYISFYATAQDKEYPAEHFGVAVSTEGNTDAADFTTIVDWTFGEAVGIVGAPSQAKAKRSAVRRDQAEWTLYKVDLSQYAGKEIWVAFRHFDCTDEYYFDVDDITIGNYSTGCDWICDNPAIGMPASGNGPVEFVALNDASGKDIVANITVNPSDWNEYTFAITVQPLNDVVVPVEDIKAEDGDKVEVNFEYMSSLVYDFEDGTLQGWTTIDADGDGFNWRTSKEVLTGEKGHNSKYCALSQSYDNPSKTALTPDNYMVAPMKVKATEDTYISFYATAQDKEYPAEHFGVAVSTTGNTDAADFTTIAEWTFGGVGIAGAPSQDKAKRSAVRRDQAEWVLYKVDLSQYAGQEIWVAFRHFDCTDEYILDIDDITIGDVCGLDSNCEWTNDNPSIGLAASGTGNISFDAVNKTKEEQVANITVNACKDVEGGKAYGAPMKFKVTVAPGESGIAEITADADTDAVYFTVSGIQIPADRLLPGIYLRRSAGKTDKVVVK